MSRAQIHSPPRSPASLSESVHCLVGHKTQLEYRAWGLHFDNLEFVCMCACVRVPFGCYGVMPRVQTLLHSRSPSLYSPDSRETPLWLYLGGKKITQKKTHKNGFLSFVPNSTRNTALFPSCGRSSFPFKGHSFATTTEEMHLRGDNSLPAQDEQL